ncbi:Protein of unknown function [Pyronema omphalodes CBS 100304]|uniref:Uncharacterized protein n=1 Tax=Pyronema omphalodes (strain CBS 100304) TaxID=1076935 RepID=U4LCT4_PYROM|nr:Protein of unknown function [Pyronema omphalodes CBS 100304]
MFGIQSSLDLLVSHCCPDRRGP